MSIFDQDKTWWQVNHAPPFDQNPLGSRDTLGQAMALAWEKGRIFAEPKEMWLWECVGHGGTSRNTAKISALITPNGGITFSEIK